MSTLPLPTQLDLSPGAASASVQLHRKSRKTYVAQALGHAVARRGGDGRFAKISAALSDLAGGHADGSWGQDIRE